MTFSTRFFADLVERVVKTFVQAFVGYWIAFGGGDFDTLFTLDNLKAALVTAFLAVVTALGSKPFGDHDSASVLPDPPPAPPPADVPLLPAVTAAAFAAPRPQTAEIITAAVFSERLGGWTTVYLHREATEDEGTFVLTDETRDGLRVAKYQPDRSGTHTPLGPTEMSAAGLRPTIPPVVD